MIVIISSNNNNNDSNASDNSISNNNNNTNINKNINSMQPTVSVVAVTRTITYIWRHGNNLTSHRFGAGWEVECVSKRRLTKVALGEVVAMTKIAGAMDNISDVPGVWMTASMHSLPRSRLL